MSFLLDTNICSAHIRRPGGLAHRFFQHSGRLWIASTVLGELYAGAFLSKAPDKILLAVEALRQDIGVLPFDEACALEFGKIRGTMKQLGVAGNPVDFMIAAVALVHDLTLVTNNTKDFDRIPNLRLEDWLTS